MTGNFKSLYNHYLTEFNVKNRNDPAFYDYVVVFIQQLLQRNLVNPGIGVRETTMTTVKDQYYNFIDIEDNISYKVSFLFSGSEQSPNNLRIEISNLLDDTEQPKIIENTFEETSINEIVDFLDAKAREAKQAKDTVPGLNVPAAVGDTPSEMPGAEQVPNTSQYLKGL